MVYVHKAYTAVDADISLSARLVTVHTFPALGQGWKDACKSTLYECFFPSKFCGTACTYPSAARYCLCVFVSEQGAPAIVKAGPQSRGGLAELCRGASAQWSSVYDWGSVSSLMP